jgi:hypothetical protein
MHFVWKPHPAADDLRGPETGIWETTILGGWSATLSYYVDNISRVASLDYTQWQVNPAPE